MKPSRWYYGFAILVFIGGVVSFVFFLHKNLNTLSNSLTQVVMPGKWDIILPVGAVIAVVTFIKRQKAK